jgi:MFS family permease
MDAILRNKKAWALVGLAVLTYLYTALNGGMTPVEWVIVASTLVTAFGAYITPNLAEGPGRLAKAIVAFLVPALGVVAAQVLDGLSPQEWIEAIIAGAGGIGLVAGLGNKGYVFAVKRPTVDQAVASGAAGPDSLPGDDVTGQKRYP